MLRRAPWIWGVAAAVLVGWDIVAATQGWQTLSEWVWAVSERTPLLPFACGLLMGHFFWRR